jgi:hypothetical protein
MTARSVKADLAKRGIALSHVSVIKVIRRAA